MKTEDWKRYEDIISLPHPVSAAHPQMSVADRAAQFSPFSALTGYKDAIQETGRFTGARVELYEDAREMLDMRLQNIQARMGKVGEAPPVEITCFQPDIRKDGGVYVTFRGSVKAIDPGKRLLILYKDASGPDRSPQSEEIRISLDEVIEIEELI